MFDCLEYLENGSVKIKNRRHIYMYHFIIVVSKSFLYLYLLSYQSTEHPFLYYCNFTVGKLINENED